LGGDMYSSPDEEQRLFVMRLERYRLAVKAGFYSDWDSSIVYKGYRIVATGKNYEVYDGGTRMLGSVDLVVAKTWITCRVQDMSLAEALKVVRAERKK
jgi:hypothetical protein